MVTQTSPPGSCSHTREKMEKHDAKLRQKRRKAQRVHRRRGLVRRGRGEARRRLDPNPGCVAGDSSDFQLWVGELAVKPYREGLTNAWV